MKCDIANCPGTCSEIGLESPVDDRMDRRVWVCTACVAWLSGWGQYSPDRPFALADGAAAVSPPRLRTLDEAEVELLDAEIVLRRRLQAMHRLRQIPDVAGLRGVHITFLAGDSSDSAVFSDGPGLSAPELALWAAIRTTLLTGVATARAALLEIAFPGESFVDVPSLSQVLE